MSLEQAIAALTAAVEANTAALSGGAAPAQKPAASGTKKPAASGTKKPATKKGPTSDVLAERFGAFLKTGTKDAREKAKQVVAGINAHFEVERITLLEEDHFGDAIAILDQYEAGEDPLEVFEEEEGEESLL